jgi:Protein of unknown function (DUF3606)
MEEEALPVSINTDTQRPIDSSRINIYEPSELTYWSRSLGISEKAVKEAVKAVGTSTKAVRKHLAEKRTAKPFSAKEVEIKS